MENKLHLICQCGYALFINLSSIETSESKTTALIQVKCSNCNRAYHLFNIYPSHQDIPNPSALNNDQNQL